MRGAIRALDAAALARLTRRMSETGSSSDPGAFGRRLLRGRDRAALATSLRGAPYASLVLFVADLDARPLMLLSDLAQHSRNIAFDPRVSLLLDATEGHPDPLTGPRLTLIGRAESVDDPRRLARFTAHHPTSSVSSGLRSNAGTSSPVSAGSTGSKAAICCSRLTQASLPRLSRGS